MPPKQKQPPRRKARSKKNKSLLTFNVLAVMVVGAMVFGTVGVALFTDIFNGPSDSTTTVNADDPDPVEQGYRDAMTKTPNDVDTILVLASYLANTGKNEEAIKLYEQALSLAPDDLAVRLSFATQLSGMGKQYDAELQYQKIIAADPTNGNALIGLARLYRSWSPPRNEDAITWYRLAMERAPDSAVHTLAQQELAALIATPVASPAASPQATLGASPAA